MSKRIADLLILVGLGLAVAGIAAIYVPAALIAGGVSLAAFGAFAVQVDR